MFVGVGLGAYGAGIFHLMTHAFFKGLLFLMAGSVMHALHGELNIFRMDRLWDELPVTGSLAIVGGLGLAGFPLVSGFWSKDEILLASIGSGDPLNWVLFLMLAFAALLTAFYTFRMVFVAFFTSNTQETTYESGEVHAPGWRMIAPMVLLAVPTLLGYFLAPLTHELGPGHVGGHGYHTVVMGASVTVSLLGILLAYLLYVGKFISPENITLEPVRSVVRDQYYVEVLYRNVIVKPLRAVSERFWVVIDDLVVDGLVNLTGASVDISGLVLRFVQTGSVRHYVVYLTTGFTVLISFAAYFWLFF